MNEDKQLKKRYVKFNPTELQRVAGQAMGEDHCPFIVKFAEGGFNKVFLLGTNSGKEIIARIPTPIAGPPHYTTASEVATMAFLRDILGVPIPKVLAYSTDSTNPVGAEYIVMERIEGLLSRNFSLIHFPDTEAYTLKIPYLGMRHYLYQQTGYPWDGDVINLRAALVGITTSHIWSNITSECCPVTFSDQERRTAMEESNEWNESEELLAILRNDLGIDPEGGTEPANFEWASRRNLEYRLEMLRQAEEDERDICWRNWPFKDDTDVSSPPLVS
ncbi:hypothetical protein AnigIFM49718_006674 [Aspergillus niger]|nr:hypothetical protein AnigIFM49718_006674 [Aspergillus niger]